MKFSKLAERQILKAQQSGALDKIKGAGRPLPDRPSGDFATQAGFRIMADAGAVPEEIRLKKAVKNAAAALVELTDPAERKAAMARLADLQMRLAITEEARRKYYR